MTETFTTDSDILQQNGLSDPELPIYTLYTCGIYIYNICGSDHSWQTCAY